MRTAVAALALLILAVVLVPERASASCWKQSVRCSLEGCSVYIPEGATYPEEPERFNSGDPIGVSGWYTVSLGYGCGLVDESANDGCLNKLSFVTVSGFWGLAATTQTFGAGCCSVPCPPPGTGCEPN